MRTKILTPSVETSKKKESKFKHISNEIQCASNECVSKELALIKSGLTAGNLSQQQIVASNKKAKIGDKYGLHTVSEYNGNPLADDFNDTRWLRQAETTAILH